MGLRLEIVSAHRRSLGERSVKEFGPDGGTIGRSLESDWVLPDGQRYLSSRHASIDFRSGSYYVVDTSTNGVYINGADQPVGRGNPQRLFSGDRIRLGEYEMAVSIDEIDGTHEQLSDARHIDPVDAAQRVEAPDPTSRDLVDAYEITGVGIEYLLDEDEAATLNPPLTSESRGNDYDVSELTLAEDSGPRRASAVQPPAQTAPQPAGRRSEPPASAQPKRQPTAQPKRQPKRQASAQPKRPPSTQAKQPAEPPRQRTDQPAGGAGPAAEPEPPRAAAHVPAGSPVEAFMKAAGLQVQQLDEEQAAHMMHRLGQVFRETIIGLTENLHLRAAQKNMLRQPNTTIQPRSNNPLKFSAGVDEAMANLVFRQSSEYLPAVEAVRDAFKDIKLHQQSLLHAIQAAVSRYIGRLDPDQLEEKFGNGRRGPLMNAANKLKYWDFYKDLYLVVAQHPSGELPAQFVEELSRAYEQEIAKADTPAEQLKAG